MFCSFKPSLFKQLYRIYCSSFPKHERRERKNLEKILLQKKARALVRLKEKCVMGFAIYWQLGDFCFLEHFAVHEKKRGKGHGSEIVSALSKKCRKIVCEIEPPTRSLKAKKRLAFYKKRGFRVIEKNYVQPAYSPGKKPVRLWLVANFKAGGSVAPLIHEKVYGKTRV